MSQIQISEYQKHEIRRRVALEVTAELWGRPQAEISAEIDKRCERQIAAASRTSWGPATPEQRDAGIAAMVSAMTEAMRPPAPPAPVAAYTPPAPKIEAAPPLPRGIFPAPPGSKILQNGKVRTPDGRTLDACDAEGNRIHMSRGVEYEAPAWVFCKSA